MSKLDTIRYAVNNRHWFGIHETRFLVRELIRNFRAH